MSLKGFMLLACMLAGGAVGAQENKAEKPKWDVWADLHFGASFLDGSKGFTDYMQSNLPSLDYRSSYLGAIQGGVGAGVEYGRFSLGLYVDRADGSSGVAVKNQLVKKDDMHFHLDFGYRITLAKLLILEPSAGFGVSTSDIFLSTSRGGADYVNSFTTGNFIVPLTLNFTTVGKEGDVGIYLQYIVSAGQIGTTRITGLETEVDGLHFQPTTLTLGVKEDMAGIEIKSRHPVDGSSEAACLLRALKCVLAKCNNRRDSAAKPAGPLLFPFRVHSSWVVGQTDGMPLCAFFVAITYLLKTSALRVRFI